MDFEFDPNKSAANKEKHGIDFIEAQALWNAPDLIEVPACCVDEPRFLISAKWTESIGRQLSRGGADGCASSQSAAPGKRRPHCMKAEEFDKKFDGGEEDTTGLLDLSKARRPAYSRSTYK